MAHIRSMQKILSENVNIKNDDKTDIGEDFHAEFEDWIKNNTSGVVIIQIRGTLKNNPVEDFEYKTFSSKLTSSFGSIGSNITNSQDYLQDYMIQGLDDVLKNQLDIVSFEYSPAENEKRVSLSLSLSENEKMKVSQSALSYENKAKYERVIKLLE